MFCLLFHKANQSTLFTCWDCLLLASSQGVSCLLFYDFLITSHGSLCKLRATRLPAEICIREWEEWIIKGSHLEIMKRSKMPVLIAQGAMGIIRKCYCYFFQIIMWCEMQFAGVRYMVRKPLGEIKQLFLQNPWNTVSTFTESHTKDGHRDANQQDTHLQ